MLDLRSIFSKYFEHREFSGTSPQPEPDTPNNSENSITNPGQEQLPEPFEYKIIDTKEKFECFLTQLIEQELFAIDTETNGLAPVHHHIIGISFYFKERAYYLPLRHLRIKEPQLEPQYCFSRLKLVLENLATIKIFHNAKFDLKMLAGEGIKVKGRIYDTYLLAKLLLPEEKSYGLKELAEKHLFPEAGKWEEKIKQYLADRDTEDFSLLLPSQLATYACADAYLTYKLFEKFHTKIPEEMKSLTQTEMKLVPIIAEMELVGIRIEPEILWQKIEEATIRREEIRQQLFTLTGKEFNPNSYPQLCEILDQLGLAERLKNEAGKISTKEEYLKQIDHPFTNTLLIYRELDKKIQQAQNLLASHHNSVIHAEFNQLGTRTGRFSSSNPNLQNVPPDLREAFVPRDGRVLVSIDYSQIELRILAELSRAQKMLQAFAAEKDLHQITASLIYAQPEEAITDEQRKIGKNVNFAVIYGMGPESLAKRLKIDEKKAKEFLDNFFKEYSEIKHLRNKLEKEVQGRRGFSNPYGRWLSLKPDERYRALNYLIQSTAADLLKQAMVRIGKLLGKYSSQILLTIHDELVIEMPKEELRLIPIIKQLMETSPFSVPIKVSVKLGHNWKEMVPLEEWLNENEHHQELKEVGNE